MLYRDLLQRVQDLLFRKTKLQQDRGRNTVPMPIKHFEKSSCLYSACFSTYFHCKCSLEKYQVCTIFAVKKRSTYNLTLSELVVVVKKGNVLHESFYKNKHFIFEHNEPDFQLVQISIATLLMDLDKYFSHSPLYTYEISLLL